MHNVGGIYRIAEELFISQEGHCSMELEGLIAALS
jgi:hypothetical protein